MGNMDHCYVTGSEWEIWIIVKSQVVDGKYGSLLNHR